MIRVYILLLFFLLGYIAPAQQHLSLIDRISKYYKNFEYKKVITLSDSLIMSDKQLAQPLLIELYLLKALSHYSLNEEVAAQISFISILELDPDFDLDPLENSPKIVSFFNQVKEEYNKQQQQLPGMGYESTPVDSVSVTVQEKSIILRSALLRSVIVPGWGHLFLKKKTKGVIFSSLAVSSALAAVFYSIRTHNKEKGYLNEINKTKIEGRYQTYNKAYKLRNIVISAYVVIWLYTQFDLLMFEDQQLEEKSISISLHSFPYYDGRLLVNVAVRF
jgi:hypothetical protein